jgi:hypothetical protein
MGSHFRGSAMLGATIVALSVFAIVGLEFFFGARFVKCAKDVNGPLAAFGVPSLVLEDTWFRMSLRPHPYIKACQGLASVGARMRFATLSA